ncbi:MAG: hypothetical protein VB835_19565 [Pirellulales bacterium]
MKNRHLAETSIHIFKTAAEVPAWPAQVAFAAETMTLERLQ